MVFRHPKYYKELRKRNRDLSELQQVKLERSVPQSDQAISPEAHDGERERAPGPGLKQQAASDSQVVNQVKLSSQSQAASDERQATSEGKLQATSSKRQASE